jgi:hypothetical protein
MNLFAISKKDVEDNLLYNLPLNKILNKEVFNNININGIVYINNVLNYVISLSGKSPFLEQDVYDTVLVWTKSEFNKTKLRNLLKREALYKGFDYDSSWEVSNFIINNFPNEVRFLILKLKKEAGLISDQEKENAYNKYITECLETVLEEQFNKCSKQKNFSLDKFENLVNKSIKNIKMKKIFL